MTEYFQIADATKLKDGRVKFNGRLMRDVHVVLGGEDSPTGGGVGPGGGGDGPKGKPPHDFHIRELADVVWIYADGTPRHALEAMRGSGIPVVHLDDLPEDFPFA